MEKRIFISYSWADAEAVNRLDNQFQRFQINLTRDIRALAYDASIHDFMDTIQQHDQLIIYVSDHYLRSINCMYEASQALSMNDKVKFIVKTGTKLFSPEDKINLINYWTDCLERYTHTYPAQLEQEIHDTKIACDHISDFIDLVKGAYRMDDQHLDFDTLLNDLKISKSYPQVINKPVYDWIAKYPQARLSNVISLISDLYKSKTIALSRYPNIPDGETNYLFNGIEFTSEVDGITLFLSVNDIKSHTLSKIPYSHMVKIEANNMRSSHHSKYCLYCENPSKKQRHMELRNFSNFKPLTSGENEELANQYWDAYRIIIHF